jgi:hypothetical protein
MVVDNLIATLESLGNPVKKQGSLLPDESYPDHFFTYWNNSSDGSSYYSNDEGAIIWNYTVCSYSIDELLTDSNLMEAKKLLRQAGFIVAGAGYDVVSDEPTHTGRGITVLYREKL